MRDMTYRPEREPYKGGDAGDIDETEPSEDPIMTLKSRCSDPACDRGTINRGKQEPRVCPCLYQARVQRWLYEMQFEVPVEKSPLEDHGTGRLIVRGSTWANTTRHLARRLLSGGIGRSLNDVVPKLHRQVEVVRLSSLVDAVLRSRRKFAIYKGKFLIVRTTAGSARQREVNAECLHEFLGFAEDHRLGAWLVDEPSERLEPGHRAWSPDVAKALKEMKFVDVEVEPAPDLDFSLLDRVDHVAPPSPSAAPRLTYVHPDPTARFPNGAVPTSSVDAAGMLCPRRRGIGPAYAFGRPDEEPFERQIRDNRRPLDGASALDDDSTSGERHVDHDDRAEEILSGV
jgi:hypothetical protein